LSATPGGWRSASRLSIGDMMMIDDIFLLCVFTVLTTPIVLVAWVLEKVLERRERRPMATIHDDDQED